MKVKTYSLLFKCALVALGLGGCVLKWTGIFCNATINEIWVAMSFAYGIGLGTIDFNITADSLKGV